MYVGITNDMKKRVYQHKFDKLKNIKDPVIYYFPVKYRADAEMLETYLINHYGTGKYYNVSKTKKGDFSFFDMCDSLPWTRFTKEVDKKLEPFTVSMFTEKEVIVEKPVFIDARSTEGKIKQIDEDYKAIENMIDDLIEFEEHIVHVITSIPGFENSLFHVKGLYLHKKRLKCAKLLKKCFGHYPFIIDTVFGSGKYKKRWDRLLMINDNTRYAIELHEKAI